MIKSRPALQKLFRLLNGSDGPTAVEYAFLIALILVVAMTGIAVFGDATGESFQNSSDAIDSAFSSGGGGDGGGGGGGGDQGGSGGGGNKGNQGGKGNKGGNSPKGKPSPARPFF